MYVRLRTELAETVQETLGRVFGPEAAGHRVLPQYPAQAGFGDFALTFPFELARVLRQAPARIAATFLEAYQPPDWVERLEAAGGGYINVFLDRTWLLSRLLSAHGPEEIWPVWEPAPGKVVVEHTNINPNKAAHIGHLRNAVLGDGLVRLMRFNGYRVEVQNYIDNTGVQVADVVVGFHHMEKRGLAEVAALTDRFDHYCWDLYARVAGFYEASEANRGLRPAALEAIESGQGPMAELAEHVAARIVHCHLDTMARLDISYDVLPRESDILHLQFWAAAFDRLREQGVIALETEGPNHGCWVMHYEKDGQPDTKILVRSNGTVTYTGKDIAYQLWKLGLLDRDFHYRPLRERADGGIVWMTCSQPPPLEAGPVPAFGHGDWVYNVIDARQSYTQNVVAEAVRRLGHEAAADRSVHFAYEMVALSPRCAVALGFALTPEEQTRSHVEVSGRRGLGVKADDLIDRLVERAQAEVALRNADLDPATRARMARDIAVGALRYFMVKYTRNSLIVFDLDDALSFDGETGPYLQYSVVRARNILRKYMDRYGLDEPELAAAWAALAKAPPPPPEDVWELIGLALRLRDVARSSLTSLELSTLARYLYNLGQRFSNFYNRHRIIGEEDEARRLVLLGVVDLYVKAMERGLGILGIPVPDRM